MALEILSCDGDEGRRWEEAILELPPSRRDIHLLPQYSQIYGECYGFQPLLALYRAPQAYVVQPFVRRPLSGLQFLSGSADAGRHSDIANAYGYGGPVSNVGGKGAALGASFAKAFAEWCEQQEIASEFCSLNPLLADEQRSLLPPELSAAYVKDVVVVDLRPEESVVAQALRKGHRSSIALARRSSVRVESVEPDSANFTAFQDMYKITMDRRHAAERWYVPEQFFASTFANLGGSRATLLFAYVGDQLESGCVLMHDFSTAYYHFAGTYANHPTLGVNNALVWEAAMHCKRAGYQRLHLGGGVTDSPEDPLLRFKGGFTSGRAPLYTYFTIRNRAVYDELCARKRAHERSTQGAESTSEFLPLYRR